MSNREQFRAGLFATIGVVLVLSLIIFLGKDRFIFSKKVSLFAEFSQVQGLGQGSIVTLGGLPVGNVGSLKFDSKKQKMIVELKINQENLDELYEGSTVELKTQGALGDKFIFIQPGPASENHLREGSTVPVTAVSDLFGIISERGKEASGIFDIIKDLKDTSQQIKDGQKIKSMISNFEVASQNLKATTEDLKQIVRSFKENEHGKMNHSIEKLDRILTKIDSGTGTLGALINDPSVHQQLKSMLGGSDARVKVRGLLRQSQDNPPK